MERPCFVLGKATRRFGFTGTTISAKAVDRTTTKTTPMFLLRTPPSFAEKPLRMRVAYFDLGLPRPGLSKPTPTFCFFTVLGQLRPPVAGQGAQESFHLDRARRQL